MLRCWFLLLIFCTNIAYSQSRNDLYKSYFFEKDSIQKKINGENFVKQSLEDAKTVLGPPRISILMKAELVRRKIYPRGNDSPTLMAFDTLYAEINKHAFRIPYLLQQLKIQQSLGDSTFCRELHLKLMRVNLLLQNSKNAFYHQSAYYRLLNYQWKKDISFNGEKNDSLQSAIKRHSDSLSFEQEQNNIEWKKQVQKKNSRIILILVSSAVLLIAFLLFLLKFRKPKTEIKLEEKVVYKEREVLKEVVKEVVKETKESDYLLQQISRNKRTETDLLKEYFNKIFYHSTNSDRLLYFVNDFVAGKKQVILFHYTQTYTGKDKLLLEQFIDSILTKHIKELRTKDLSEILNQLNQQLNALNAFPDKKYGLKISALSFGLQPVDTKLQCNQIHWCGAGARLLIKSGESLNKLESKINFLGSGDNSGKISLYEIKPQENLNLINSFDLMDDKLMQELFGSNNWDEKNKALTFLLDSAKDSILAFNF